MEKDGTSEGVWHRADSEKFWRKVSTPDHVVQIYEHEKQLLDCLVAFAVCGFNDDESVVVIGTADHLEQLDNKLRSAGYDLFSLRLRDQYLTLDATKSLYEFTINGVPDPILFRLVVSNLLKGTKRRGRKVRAFSEIGAILWTQGNADNTLCLEQLWGEQVNSESFSLFCAYPKSSFAPESRVALDEICRGHTHLVAPSVDWAAVSYKTTDKKVATSLDSETA